MSSVCCGRIGRADPAIWVVAGEKPDENGVSGLMRHRYRNVTKISVTVSNHLAALRRLYLWLRLAWGVAAQSRESRASSRGRPGLRDRLRPCRSGPRGCVSATASAHGGHLHFWTATASDRRDPPSQAGLGHAGNLRCRSGVVASKIVGGGHATRGRLQLNRGMTGFDFGG